MSESKIKTDKTGHPIPESIMEDWFQAENELSLVRTLEGIHGIVEVAIEGEDPVFSEVTKSTLADLSNAITALKCVIPYAVCPICEGRMKETCTLCRKRGFISKFRWAHCVPEEIKMIRMRGKK